MDDQYRRLIAIVLMLGLIIKPFGLMKPSPDRPSPGRGMNTYARRKRGVVELRLERTPPRLNGSHPVWALTELYGAHMLLWDLDRTLTLA